MFSPVSIHVNKRTITQRNNTAAELVCAENARGGKKVKSCSKTKTNLDRLSVNWTWQDKPPSELKLNGLSLGLVKMERDINRMGDEPFHVNTDHRLLVNIVKHLDASKPRSMQRIVVKQQLYSISQFPNLILEYVLGNDNLADIFSQPPIV